MGKEVESDVSALTRRIMLMEEEDKKSAEQLCQTITKLSLTSKAADNVMKTIKVVENTCLNNEVTIEELDKNLRPPSRWPPTTSRSLTSSPGSWVCRRLSSRGLWRGPSGREELEGHRGGAGDRR